MHFQKRKKLPNRNHANYLLRMRKQINVFKKLFSFFIKVSNGHMNLRTKCITIADCLTFFETDVRYKHKLIAVKTESS